MEESKPQKRQTEGWGKLWFWGLVCECEVGLGQDYHTKSGIAIWGTQFLSLPHAMCKTFLSFSYGELWVSPNLF